MNKRAATAGILNHHRRKRREAAAEEHHPLLPGLPDDITELCLSLVPPSTLYSVCRTWRRLLYSPSFPPFLSLYAVVSSSDRSLNHIAHPVELRSFDPISSEWRLLPPPPSPSPNLLIRHRSYIARNIPIQSVSASGKLVFLAGTDDDFLPALSHPLAFDPSTGNWSHGPRFGAPRRWCAAGALGGAVYVASGIGASYTNDVARQVEKWDPAPPASDNRWRRMEGQKDGRFCREAIEAVGWKGKLCMVNVKGDVAKDGTIYDAGKDCWEKMPPGMLAGWKGPAAAMEEETMYVVDETKGLLRKYDELRDVWVVVAESGVLKGAQNVAAAGGRVCVLCADGVRIAVVDVESGRVWTVQAPAGIHVLGIHILPRLTEQGLY